MTWQQMTMITMMFINILVLVGLAWQLYHNQTKQLTVAKAVLSSYAGLAAEQLAKNVKSQIGYNALYQLGQIWSHPDDPTATIIAFFNSSEQDLNPNQLEVQKAIQNVQLINTKKSTIHNIIHPKLMDLPTTLPDLNTGDTYGFKAIHEPMSPNLSFKALIKINPEYAVLVKYKDSYVRHALEQSIMTQPLLPSALTETENNEGLGFELIDANGMILWTSSTETNGVRSRPYILGSDYGGLFQEFQLASTIDESLAPDLIIGGLPKSQKFQIAMLILVALFSIWVMFWLNRKTTLLNKSKSLFIARASHELKTPLTQIRLFAETLELNRIQDKESQKDYLRIIKKESIRLGQLVDNILNHHHADPDHLPTLITHIECLPLASFLNGVVNEQSILWSQKNITMIMDVDPKITLTTDANLLKQIIINLLDNAVKYGPEQHTITLTTEASKAWHMIKIQDQGPGIPPEQTRNALKSYQRLHRDEQRGINGNGLGLSITNQLLTHLGGHLSFEHPNIGLTVLISLPNIHSESTN